MKFELVRVQRDEPYFPSWIIKISRTEFLNKYNENKEEFLKDLNFALEMYCSPNCFVRQLSESAVANIAKNFKTTYKSVFFDVRENKDGRSDLLIGYF